MSKLGVIATIDFTEKYRDYDFDVADNINPKLDEERLVYDQSNNQWLLVEEVDE